MTVHVTIALDEAVKAKLDALADARQAPIDDIVAMAVLDMAVEEEAAPSSPQTMRRLLRRQWMRG